ncbi:unnamed protein product [Periconia digitata]|uniref:Uncharacterized protein n=1 Tax=Periconia digitata TaxID=1303443 RepID=A0A9W4UPA5_9PLEO|nr:unnamed protein product [Periconia digitata]
MADTNMETPDLQQILATLASFAEAENATPQPTQLVDPSQLQSLHQEPLKHNPTDSSQQYKKQKREQSRDPRLGGRSTLPTHPSSNAQHRPSSVSIDPATITEWKHGLRYVTKLAMQKPDLGDLVRKLIRDEQRNFKDWANGRQRFIQEQELKRENEKTQLAALSLTNILGDMEPHRTPEREQEELSQYDLKIYRACGAMVDSQSKTLAQHGVPFFGVRPVLISDNDVQLLDEDSNAGQEPTKTITNHQVLQLQRKMLGHLLEIRLNHRNIRYCGTPYETLRVQTNGYIVGSTTPGRSTDSFNSPVSVPPFQNRTSADSYHYPYRHTGPSTLSLAPSRCPTPIDQRDLCKPAKPPETTLLKGYFLNQTVKMFIVKTVMWMLAAAVVAVEPPHDNTGASISQQTQSTCPTLPQLCTGDATMGGKSTQVTYLCPSEKCPTTVKTVTAYTTVCAGPSIEPTTTTTMLLNSTIFLTKTLSVQHPSSLSSLLPWSSYPPHTTGVSTPSEDSTVNDPPVFVFSTYHNNNTADPIRPLTSFHWSVSSWTNKVAASNFASMTSTKVLPGPLDTYTSSPSSINWTAKATAPAFHTHPRRAISTVMVVSTTTITYELTSPSSSASAGPTPEPEPEEPDTTVTITISSETDPLYPGATTDGLGGKHPNGAGGNKLRPASLGIALTAALFSLF